MVKNIIMAILSLVIMFLIVKNHWSAADLSPLATIVGAIITGLITWFAVYETSRQDRENRKMENAYRYFEDKVIKLSSCIPDINKLNAKYFDGQEGKANKIDNDIILTEFRKIDNIKSILESIVLHNPPETSIIRTFIDQLEKFRNVLEHVETRYKNIGNNPCNFIKKDSSGTNKFYIFFEDLRNDIQKNTNYHFEKLNIKDINDLIRKYLYLG